MSGLCDATAKEHADEENVRQNTSRWLYKAPGLTMWRTESNELDQTGLPLSTATPVALLCDDLTQEVHHSLVSSCLLSKTIARLSKHTARPRSSCKEKAAIACSPDYITTSSFFQGVGGNQWPPKKTLQHPTQSSSSF